jgi:hypothetical protein
MGPYRHNYNNVPLKKACQKIIRMRECKKAFPFSVNVYRKIQPQRCHEESPDCNTHKTSSTQYFTSPTTIHIDTSYLRDMEVCIKHNTDKSKCIKKTPLCYRYPRIPAMFSQNFRSPLTNAYYQQSTQDTACNLCTKYLKKYNRNGTAVCMSVHFILKTNQQT